MDVLWYPNREVVAGVSPGGVRSAAPTSAADAAASVANCRALVAALGSARVAVPLGAVAAVVAAPPAVPLPLAPAYLRGVVAWQGQLIPLLDLSLLLGLAPPPVSSEALVLRQGEALLALRVTRVHGEAELALPAAASDRPAAAFTPAGLAVAKDAPSDLSAVAAVFGRPARAEDGTSVYLLDSGTLFVMTTLTAVLG